MLSCCNFPSKIGGGRGYAGWDLCRAQVEMIDFECSKSSRWDWQIWNDPKLRKTIPHQPRSRKGELQLLRVTWMPVLHRPFVAQDRLPSLACSWIGSWLPGLLRWIQNASSMKWSSWIRMKILDEYVSFVEEQPPTMYPWRISKTNRWPKCLTVWYVRCHADGDSEFLLQRWGRKQTSGSKTAMKANQIEAVWE